MQSPFHFATHVTDLEETITFYTELLGCKIGRESDRWVDFDFFGHQVSMHLGPPPTQGNEGTDGERSVPMPHFGVILPLDEWQALSERLVAANIDFIIPPTIRFEGKPGEQRTMFFRDPTGNALEIKGFADSKEIFAS